MKVLALEGSPRKGGNSSILLDWVLEGAGEGGGEVIRLRVAELDIHPCTGCDSCLDTGECVIRDDMDQVIDLVLSSHHLVVATPVYFYHVPAQLKALIDRFQPLWVRKAVLGISPRKRGNLVVVACGATKGKRLFQGILLTFNNLTSYLGLEMYPSSLLVRGVESAGEVLSLKGFREEAKKLGLTMMQRGRGEIFSQ